MKTLPRDIGHYFYTSLIVTKRIWITNIELVSYKYDVCLIIVRFEGIDMYIYAQRVWEFREKKSWESLSRERKENKFDREIMIGKKGNDSILFGEFDEK